MTAPDQNVLVGVLRTKRDCAILFSERWYRIPVVHAPVRRFQYLAFYQPALFGRQGKCIRYYARVVNRRTLTRSTLLPDEPGHPRAGARYIRIRVGMIKVLPRPIRNRAPRRVSFGFTTLHRLLTSKTILQLYRVAPTEQMVGKGLRRAGIRAVPQYRVAGGRKRYCLDFAVRCRRGSIAIECDNTKAHAGARRRAKDRMKDAFLTRHGWTVIRLGERDIVSHMNDCIAKVRHAVRKLDGLQKGIP